MISEVPSRTNILWFWDFISHRNRWLSCLGVALSWCSLSTHADLRSAKGLETSGLPICLCHDWEAASTFCTSGVRRDPQCPWNSVTCLWKPSQMQTAGVWVEWALQASQHKAPHGTACFVMELKTFSFQALPQDFQVHVKVIWNWWGVVITWYEWVFSSQKALGS